MPEENVDDHADVNANFREAMVILAGGALILRAFNHITMDVDFATSLKVDWKRIVRIVGKLGRAVGSLETSTGDDIGQMEYSW